MVVVFVSDLRPHIEQGAVGSDKAVHLGIATQPLDDLFGKSGSGSHPFLEVATC